MSSETIVRHLAAMGTAFTLAVSAPTREAALGASEAGVREIERIEALLSTWRDDTPLARLNAATPGTAVELPADLFKLLQRVFEWETATGGAFNPAVGPLVRAWGLRTGGRVPDATALALAREASRPGLFTFEESSLRVIRSVRAAGIDEGAWGKGWALDKAAVAMRDAGAFSGLLDLGGQILAFGEETSIDVVDPLVRGRTFGTLRLKNASASTSGNSERGVAVNGRRIGHLLDPRTGEPAPDFGSVTVVAPTGFVADILSTAFFVLGEKESQSLSERLRAEGVAHEMLFFLEGEEGQALRVSMSRGMEPLVDPRPELACGPTRHDARSPRTELLPLTHSKKSEGARQ